jgi:hypothetical protein
MRETLELDDTLLNQATVLTGILEKTALVTAGLEALIALENIKRLAKLKLSKTESLSQSESWLRCAAGDEQLAQARQEFAAGQWIEVNDLDELFQ